MNNWIAIGLVAAIFFLLDEGYPFFALILGVVLLLMLLASFFSSARSKKEEKKSEEPAPVAASQWKQDHAGLQNTFLLLGKMFNWAGKGLYELFSGKK